jgi:hypothetical protein
MPVSGAYTEYIQEYAERGIGMASKKKVARKGNERPSATVKHWIGQPVCVVLKDGSYYVGMVEGIDGEKLKLAGTQGPGIWGSSFDTEDRVQVSGFLQSLTGGLPGNAAGGLTTGQGLGGGGGGSFFDTVKQWWPTITFGMQMVRSIMPLLGMFKI